MNNYEKPGIAVIGTLHELTLAPGQITKTGKGTDVYSSLSGLTGSIVSVSTK